ncbi:S41 family peptidase [Flagellimonas lutimaris]|nr:S41 family peptidase [Allomuricauda lutimaris]
MKPSSSSSSSKVHNKLKQVYLFHMLVVLVFLFFLSCHTTTDHKVNKEEQDVISSITNILEKNYVDKEIATELSRMLKENKSSGKYEGLDNTIFVARVNRDIRSIVNDRHLQVMTNSPSKKLPWSKSSILKVDVLEGNIGYLKLSVFPNPNKEYYGQMANALGLLKDTNGIIIDLSDNGGGHPDAVSNLLGYFVENKTLYDSFYVPSIDKSFEYTTRGEVKGHKLMNMPLGIIVNERTASVAELCALAFQNLQLGKVYGTTTMGLVNLAEYYPINDSLYLLASKGKQKNPFNVNIEDKGVIPDIRSDNAIVQAHLDLIKKAHGSSFKDWYNKSLGKTPVKLNDSLINTYVGNYGYLTIGKKDSTLYYNDEMGFSYQMIPLNENTFGLKLNSDERFRLIFKENRGEVMLIKKYFDGSEISYERL